MSTEDNIHPWRLAQNHISILLGHTTTHRDLHPGMARLDCRHVPKIAVKTVVSVFAHRTGVEDHHICSCSENGFCGLRGTHQAGFLQQTRDPFGIVDVHLAAVGNDVVSA